MIGILGGSGYVGSAICRALQKRAEKYISLSRQQIDYYRPAELRDWMIENQISFLINSAGYTGKPNVDACEVNQADCLLGNAVLPGVIREACENLGVPFGHVSSGCIYTGNKPGGDGFTEIDTPNFCFRTNNCSFYSGCKALGEEVLEGCDLCYVWRLRIPFDEWDGERNYLSKLLRYSRLLDVRNSFTHLGEFAASCVNFVEGDIPFGIYNMTNTGSLNTREVVELIKESVAPGQTFEFFESEAEFMNVAATAPRSNCVLDNSKAVGVGVMTSDIETAFRKALHNWSGSELHVV